MTSLVILLSLSYVTAGTDTLQYLWKSTHTHLRSGLRVLEETQLNQLGKRKGPSADISFMVFATWK